MIDDDHWGNHSSVIMIMMMMTLLMIDVDHKEGVHGANYDSITCHKLSYKSNFSNGDDNYNNDGHDNDDGDNNNHDDEDDNDDDDDDDDDYHRRERHSRDSLRKVPSHQLFMQKVNYHFVILIFNFIIKNIVIVIIIVMWISRQPGLTSNQISR